jgi:hypothetical protein
MGIRSLLSRGQGVRYLDWGVAHLREGCVVSKARSHRASYLMLHRARYTYVPKGLL